MRCIAAAGRLRLSRHAGSPGSWAAIRNAISGSCYTLPKDGPRVQWEGESMWSADELASRRARPSRERAREFLRTFLAAGPRTVNDVYAAGLELGASRPTIRRAKDDLGIRCQAVLYGSNRTDYWLMENQNLPTTDSDQCKVNELLDDVSRQYPRRPMLDAE